MRGGIVWGGGEMYHDFIEDLLRGVDGRWLDCRLKHTNGRSKGGTTQYVFIMPRWSQHYDGKHWRHMFKAYDLREALEHVRDSRAVRKMLELRWNEEFNNLIGEG